MNQNIVAKSSQEADPRTKPGDGAHKDHRERLDFVAMQVSPWTQPFSRELELWGCNTGTWECQGYVWGTFHFLFTPVNFTTGKTSVTTKRAYLIVGR